MKEWCGMCLMSVSVESEQVNRVSGEGWCGMCLMSVSVESEQVNRVSGEGMVWHEPNVCFC